MSRNNGGGYSTRPRARAEQQPHKLCRQYMAGKCTFDPCKYAHDDAACFDFWKYGECTDARCAKRHDAAWKGQGADRQRDQAPTTPAPAVDERQRNQRGGRRDGGRQKRDDEYGNNDRNDNGDLPRGKGLSKLPRPRVNTENFKPSHEPCTMRVVVDTAPNRLSVPLTVRDVLLVPCMFSRPGDEDIYDRLSKEMEHCTIPEDDLLKSWHGDSHWIADDSTGWKKQCPTFLDVVERLRAYFRMDIKATRFNWYKDTSEWKPYHHDAAAVKPDKARTQNFTVGVSFGATRDAAFEDAATRTTIAFPLPHGSVYCFSRDTNILWRHGILQEKEVRPVGRISIIAWGWVDQEEC